MKGDFVANSVDNLIKDWRKDDNYYDNADKWVEKFWRPDTVFRQCFDRMDHGVILELACGRGRHTWQMRNWPNLKIMTDPVEENIDFCKQRFDGVEGVALFVGNGLNLAFQEDNTLTSAFCYDAMVHFDHLIVFGYLVELSRVLRPGGMALLHHSNLQEGAGRDYKQNPNWRAFMPAGLFSDYTAKANLELIDQFIIPWGNHPSSDALSLLRKA